VSLTLLFVALGSLGLGYFLALALFRSRVELARTEAAVESRQQLAFAQARITQLEEDQRNQAERARALDAALEALRQDLNMAGAETARSQARAEGEQRRAGDLEARLQVLLEEGRGVADALAATREALAGAQAQSAETAATLEARTLDRDRLSGRTAQLEQALQVLRQDLLEKSEALAGVEATVVAERIRANGLDEQVRNLSEERRLLFETHAITQEELSRSQALAAETAATLEARNQERETLIGTSRQQELELQALRGELLSKSEAVATLQSQFEGLEQTAAVRLEALTEAQTRLSETFRSLSAEALQANNASFLQLAQTQLEGHQTQAAQDLEARQLAIAGLMQPVQTGLNAMQEQVQSLSRERATAEATLVNQIQTLVSAQAGLQAETGKLASALRKPEVKGRWGEVQLRNVVEYAGMTEHVDFDLQSSMESEDGKLRPDLMVKLPGGKRIAVDAKAPLRAYLEALEAEEGSAREASLEAVAGQVRAQVKNLGDKRYFSGLTESPDFVVLFLPLEALFSTALGRDPQLLDFALQQNVILASPTTLVALLKAVSYGWTQERIQANADEIQKLGSELLDRMRTMATHTDTLRKSLVASVDAFNSFASSLESRVMVTAQKIQSLGINPATKLKTRKLGMGGPGTIHAVLSGLPRLGVQGDPPTYDVEAFEPDAGTEAAPDSEVAG
jgi:DNA recombination protein RmuC